MSGSLPVTQRRRARSLLVSGVALSVAALAFSNPAAATPLGSPLIAGNPTDIIWIAASNPAGVVSGLGTSDITLDPSMGANTLTLAIVQTVSSSVSLGGIFGALSWDTDLGDELNGPGTLTEFPQGGGFFMPTSPGFDDSTISPATQDSTLGGVSGYGLGMEMLNGGAAFMIAGPSGLTFTAFTVTFSVNGGNLAADGNDVFWGAFGTGNIIGTDGGSPGGDIYTVANSPWAGASVNLVPEPATVTLLALGCATLAVVGRRRRNPKV